MTLRKSLTGSPKSPAGSREERWLDLEQSARVEVTSEEQSYPIEGALLGGEGWRAAGPGPQTVRLIFDQPQDLSHTELLFLEPEVARTQEFALRWSSDQGRSFREVVRQQWNFSPVGSTSEAEDYRLDLRDVTILELTIVPDVSGGGACASLARWRVA